jgi:hypothetical protein
LAEDVPAVYVVFVPRIFTIRNYIKGFITDSNGSSYRCRAEGMNYTWLDR